MKRIFWIFILIIVGGCKYVTKEKMVCNYMNDNREDQVDIYIENNESVRYDKKSSVKLESIEDVSDYKDDDGYDSMEVVDNVVSMYVSENLDGMTKSEIKSLYEKIGYTCK